MDGVQLPKGYTEPLRRDNLLFTTKSPSVSGTQFFELGRIKG